MVYSFCSKILAGSLFEKYFIIVVLNFNQTKYAMAFYIKVGYFCNQSNFKKLAPQTMKTIFVRFLSH